MMVLQPELHSQNSLGLTVFFSDFEIKTETTVCTERFVVLKAQPELYILSHLYFVWRHMSVVFVSLS